MAKLLLAPKDTHALMQHALAPRTILASRLHLAERGACSELRSTIRKSRLLRCALSSPRPFLVHISSSVHHFSFSSQPRV